MKEASYASRRLNFFFFFFSFFFFCCVDADHSDSKALIVARNQLRKTNIEVFSVGIGAYSLNDVYHIASPPTSSHVFRAHPYGNLKNNLGSIGRNVCPSKLFISFCTIKKL